MIGGLGDDTYYVDTPDDVPGAALDETIENVGAGRDTVSASVSHVLQANIEVLYLTGTAETDGVGNELDNWLYGNGAVNFLSGEGGDDFLDDGAGADFMLGFDGDDTFFVDNEGDEANEGWDDGHDTVISTLNWTLSSTDGLEDLILAWGSGAITGIGNFLQNSITGNQNNNLLMGGDGDDSLNGGAGADTMWGGDGNDTFYFDDAGDRANEFAGQGLLDTVYSTVDTTVRPAHRIPAPGRRPYTGRPATATPAATGATRQTCCAA